MSQKTSEFTSSLKNHFNPFTGVAKLAADQIESVEGYTERSPSKINGNWYQAKTHVIDEPENDQDGDFIDKVFLNLEHYIQENFENENIYLTEIDIQYALATGDGNEPDFQKFDGVIIRLIIESEEYEAGLQEIGSVSDVENLLREHDSKLKEKNDFSIDVGYGFGELGLDDQLEDIKVDNQLSFKGDSWTGFYLGFRANDDADSLEDASSIDYELKSRKFVREDDGQVYEVL